MTIITKGMGAILKGRLNPKKTKGYMDTDPNVRKGIAQALKDIKKKKFIGKKSKKIPHDLSYLKGHFSKD